jgi:integrase
MKGKITKRFVDGLDKPGKWKCTDVRGFGVKVTPAGKKIYIVENNVRGGSAKVTVTIGPHGVWLTDQARDEAKRILGLMAQGINPNELKAKDRAEQERQKEIEQAKSRDLEITLERVLNDYMRSRGDSLKDSTRYIYNCVISSSLSDWMAVPIKDITREMVEARHREMTDSGKKGAANHVMRILRALFTYAMTTYKSFDGQRLLTENPVRRLSEVKAWNKLERRQGVIKTHEMHAWYQAVKKLEYVSSKDLLVFLLFTGLRRNEGANLKWSDIDFEGKTIFVKDTKNRVPHMLPMTPQLEALLKNRLGENGNDFVFPSRRKGEAIRDVRADLDKIKEASGIEFVLHDLRRTFITIAESLDIPYYAIKRLANHKDSTDVTVGYIVANVERLREPMAKISKFIDGKIKYTESLKETGSGKASKKNVAARKTRSKA